MNIETAMQFLRQGSCNEALKPLYPEFDREKEKYTGRILHLLETYREIFPEPEDIHLFSAPGRIEVGGNHTDHQHGVVLAAAIDRDAIAAAGLNGTNVIRVHSIGYGAFEVSLDDLSVHPDEKDTTQAIVRGVASKVKEAGYTLRGFDVCVTSDVPGGSGISSSAAFEVLFGETLNGLFCEGQLSPVRIAQIGQFAEQVYFGKPSGMMDQTASAVGGFVGIDFKDTSAPVIKSVSSEQLGAEYSIFVIDTNSAHTDLSSVYGEIPGEMGKVAAFFGKSVLRDVPEADFWAHIGEIRHQAGDRGVLRAIHFYEENQRAVDEINALKRGDLAGFLQLVRESGFSSFIHLQNVIVSGHIEHQEVAYALAVSEHALKGQGAVRIHGGGFGGTILAIVPNELSVNFQAEVESKLKPGACTRMHIRPIGCDQVF